MKVSSHPPGARVLVGGEALGVTPFAGTLPAGPLHLVVSMDGKNDEHTRVFLDEPLTVDAWMDPEGQLFDLVRIFPTGHLPKGLAITPDNQQVWVASLGGWGVNVHNLATGKQLKDIKLPNAGSVEMLLDADNRKAYATQMETARVFELDMDQLEILRTFHTGSNFTKVPVFSPDKKKLYASNWKGHDVVEIDLVSGKRVRSMRTVHTPRGLYVTPDGAHLYVAGYGGSGLARITLATGRSERVARGRALRHIVPSPGARPSLCLRHGRPRHLHLRPEDWRVGQSSPTPCCTPTPSTSPPTGRCCW